MTDNRKRIFETRGKPVSKKKPIYFDRRILNSKAYWALTGVAPQYLSHFLSVRQMHHIKADRLWVQTNNGKIYFTYAQAKKLYGASSGQHNRALKKLHEVGFVDVAHHGGGMDGDCTLFSISHRWKQYGTPEFEFIDWQKDYRRKGNPNIRQYGKGRDHGKRFTNILVSEDGRIADRASNE